jgi:hypothetical protein
VEKPSTKPEIITRAQEDAWFALLFAHATVTARIDVVLMEQHRISSPRLRSCAGSRSGADRGVGAVDAAGRDLDQDVPWAELGNP